MMKIKIKGSSLPSDIFLCESQCKSIVKKKKNYTEFSQRSQMVLFLYGCFYLLSRLSGNQNNLFKLDLFLTLCCV